ncbi:sialic acid-binding Ig-like lectin 15 isoform X1 [Hemiscyllium ocellatum]|uniref:sialic acid-binding Ig-like lectin 15 isoform X1 n=1 Tax=Hemiscyllium ocellatum TaxID=170820 RepID=UPI002967496A|nr:sialic acid-binding Ig-like lectin 15 isoform X1 [Hemiscyllium ocellatum]
MTIADGVRAEEGGSAVLPCSFTHPDAHLTLTGSILWHKAETQALIFKCTYPGPDHSQGELCENVRQRDGRNRFRFVGNLSNKDASIMMEGLNQEDAGSYRCRVELNINNFGSGKGTRLEVEVNRTEPTTVYLPVIPTLLILPICFIIFINFSNKGGCSQQIKRTTPLKRNDPGSSSIPEPHQAQQPLASGTGCTRTDQSPSISDTVTSSV